MIEAISIREKLTLSALLAVFYGYVLVAMAGEYQKHRAMQQEIEVLKKQLESK